MKKDRDIKRITSGYNLDYKMSDAEVAAQVGTGWQKIVYKLIDDLFAAGWDGILYQIKEKYGGLRFYIGSGNDTTYDIINKAEIKSYVTCERCGKPGKPNTVGYILTLCKTCRDSFNDRTSS